MDKDKRKWYAIRHMNKFEIAQHEAIYTKSFIESYNSAIKELEKDG